MMVNNWAEVERIFADAALWDFCQVRWLRASYDYKQNRVSPWTEWSMSLLLRLVAPYGQSYRTIDILFTDVRDLRWSISATIKDVNELEVKSITDATHTLKGLRYEISAEEENNFGCKCKNVEIVEIGIESPDGEYQREWIQSRNE